MAKRKYEKYSSRCYYKGKLVGKCHESDGNAYSIMMEECNGRAEIVLTRFAYFSAELKGILEKVAELQRKEGEQNG